MTEQETLAPNTQLIGAFRAAQQRWLDALPEDRRAIPKGTPEYEQVEALNKAMTEAGRALVLDACERHRIEEQAVVYLDFGTDGWVVHSGDGYPLEGYQSGPITGESCDHDDALMEECQAVAEAAAYAFPTPTLTELAALLADSDDDEDEDDDEIDVDDLDLAPGVSTKGPLPSFPVEGKVVLSVQIDNCYELYDSVTTYAVVVAPLDEADDLEQLYADHVEGLTGVGYTDGNSYYEVKVLESSHPDLIPVGHTWSMGG